MDQTFVGVVIEVEEVWLPVLGQSCRINGIAVVLAGDMALPGGEIQSWDVVCSVTILHLDCPCSNC